EPSRKFSSKPLIKPTTTGARRQPFDSMPQFCKCHNTEEYVILLNLLEPRDDTGVGVRLRPFRHNVRVDQETHRSVLRKRSLERLSVSPEPRRGEAAKKFASEPARRVLRSHSSADTMT